MENIETPTATRWRGKATALGLVAAGAVAGGVLASTLTASAADSSTNSAPSSTYALPQAGAPGHPCPMGGPGLGRPDEKVLTGSDAAKAKAAALEAVPGGTIIRLETDAGDAKYEAHMTKADGTPVTVKMDKDFNVTAVEDGMGKGDPRPTGPPPAAPQNNSSSSSST